MVKKLCWALAVAGVCLSLALSGCAPPAQPAPLPEARAAPTLTAAPPPPTPTPTPPPSAPQALEAELFQGIVEMPQEDYARASGWTAYTMDFYSGQRAAIAREVGGLIVARLAPLPPGDYRVTLAVYDYGTGATNRVEVTLNGVSQTLSWSGRQAGVRRISADFVRTKAGQELTIRALERGQDYIIVDQVTVKPAP